MIISDRFMITVQKPMSKLMKDVRHIIVIRKI